VMNAFPLSASPQPTNSVTKKNNLTYFITSSY
jgi:hypothetical protein